MTDRPTDPHLRDDDQHDTDVRSLRNDDASLVSRREELRVRTEQVARGRVVLRKRIVEEEQTITVTVRREELEVVEEDAADFGAAPLDDRGRDTGAFGSDRAQDEARRPEAGRGEARSDDDVEMVLHAERPVITMEVVPVERVVLRRSVTTENRTVSGDVSHEEVVVEGDGLDRADRVDT